MTQPLRSIGVWRAAILAGAVIGGIGWGWFAAHTVGAPNNQAGFTHAIGRQLATAAAVSIGCLSMAAALLTVPRRGWPGHAKTTRIGLALAVASTSGWILIASAVLQTLVLRTR